jgi:hypothetical protein
MVGGFPLRLFSYRREFQSRQNSFFVVWLAFDCIFSNVIICLGRLYKDTKAAFGTGKYIGDNFRTKTEVKQGCLRSWIFCVLSSWMTSRTDSIENLLPYGRFSWQSLYSFDQLYRYCSTWKLKVNLVKLKIIILRKVGGRLSRSEMWNIRNSQTWSKVSNCTSMHVEEVKQEWKITSIHHETISSCSS